LGLGVVVGEKEVGPPICRVKAPMTGPPLAVPVCVAHKFLRAEKTFTLYAFDASGIWAGKS